MFCILYTHQKYKKAKIWQDGFVKKAASGNKYLVLDDSNSEIDSFFASSVSIGDEFETDNFLVTIEEPLDSFKHSRAPNHNLVSCKELGSDVNALSCNKIKLMNRSFRSPLVQDCQNLEIHSKLELNNLQRHDTEVNVEDNECNVVNDLVSKDDICALLDDRSEKEVKSLDVATMNTNNAFKLHNAEFGRMYPWDDLKRSSQDLAINKCFFRESVCGKASKSFENVSKEDGEFELQKYLQTFSENNSATSPISFDSCPMPEESDVSSYTEHQCSPVRKKFKQHVLTNCNSVKHKAFSEIMFKPETISTSTERILHIPDFFASVSVFRDTFISAISEHLNLLISSTYCNFKNCVENFKLKSTPVNEMKSSEVKDHGNQLAYVTDYDTLHQKLKRKSIYYYPFCGFLKKTVNSRDKVGGSRTAYFLSLPSTRESSKFYNIDDIWLVSKSEDFKSGSFLVRSKFYGPYTSGDLEVEPLNWKSTGQWLHEYNCFALYVGNASFELSCIENLYSLQIHSPLVDYLSSPSLIDIPFENNVCNLDFLDVTLNPDQLKALNCVHRMYFEQSSPVALVHGVFGSGKSFLLAAVIMHIARQAKCESFKIILASSTNVAVDRVLKILMGMKFTDFVRVGCMRKISKQIIPFSVHAVQSEEVKELQAMIKDEANVTDKKILRHTLEKIKKGENRRRIKEVPLIAVTCAAASSLTDVKCSLLLLDEAAQMSEPIALSLLARFNAEKLVLVGDHAQLPPIVTGTDAKNPRFQLERSIFERLIFCKAPCIMLRRQYRCHPEISHLSNTLFYESQLENGVNCEERNKLIANLPSLAIINVSSGSEKPGYSDSFINPTEASAIVESVAKLHTEHKVDVVDIGVICLYKDQVKLIKTLLTESGIQTQKIEVNTVDAFQGGERKIIFLSCVRTTSSGFIENRRRINVALTRAMNHLLIFGFLKMLRNNQLWYHIVSLIDQNGAILHYNTFRSLL